MKSLTASMSNLELVKIEESAFTPPLPRKHKPTLSKIDEDYMEMQPLNFNPENNETLAQSDYIVITDNVTPEPTYSSPSPRFAPRFAFSPTLQNTLEKLSPTSDKPPEQ
jgi:hypothetical protein